MNYCQMYFWLMPDEPAGGARRSDPERDELVESILQELSRPALDQEERGVCLSLLDHLAEGARAWRPPKTSGPRPRRERGDRGGGKKRY